MMSRWGRAKARLKTDEMQHKRILVCEELITPEEYFKMPFAVKFRCFPGGALCGSSLHHWACGCAYGESL